MPAHKKPDDERKSYLLSIRITQADADQLRQEAAARGLDLSEHARQKLACHIFDPGAITWPLPVQPIGKLIEVHHAAPASPSDLAAAIMSPESVEMFKRALDETTADTINAALLKR